MQVLGEFENHSQKVGLTPEQMNSFFKLMKERYEAGRPTIITTNLAFEHWYDILQPLRIESIRVAVELNPLFKEPRVIYRVKLCRGCRNGREIVG
ncbi:MAG: ATP-binding protein [Pseudomonadota bacterium]